MKPPRLRFALLGMLLSIAVLCVLFCAARMGKQSRDYRRLAVLYAYSEGDAWRQAVDHEPSPERRPYASWYEIALVEQCRRASAYYEQLSRKYEKAALRPWLPLEPDPPFPSNPEL